MVATSALGNGINVDNVVLVVHVDCLFSMTDFVQESGRAARRESKARSVSFVRRGQFNQYKRRVIYRGDAFGPEKTAMAEFVVTSGCRRTPIGLMMDEFQTSCAQLQGQFCDNCLSSDGSNPSHRPVDLPSRFLPQSAMRTNHIPSTGSGTGTPSRLLGSGLSPGGISSILSSGSNTLNPVKHNPNPIPNTGSGTGTTSQLLGSGLSPGGISSILSSGSNILNPVKHHSRARPLFPQLSRGSSNQDGQAFLRSVFHTLSTLCPVCWLLHSPLAAAHKFRQCQHHSVTLRSFLAWSNGINFPPRCCHYPCAAPLFVCEFFGATECPYRDILLPMVLAAFRTPPYADIIRKLAQTDLSEAQLLSWIVKTTDSMGQPLMLYSRSCHNGVIAFDAIVRHRISDGF